MILNTTERKERTEDEVSDAADPDCLCLHAGKQCLPNTTECKAKFIVYKGGWITLQGAPLNTGLR